MHFKPSFYRGAAVCSVLSAITTLLLIFLPRFFEPAQGFEGRMDRVMQLSGPLAEWSYPAIQPLGRVLIGIWRWRVADETNSADLPYRSDLR